MRAVRRIQNGADSVLSDELPNGTVGSQVCNDSVTAPKD